MKPEAAESIDERYVVRDLATLLTHYGTPPPTSLTKEVPYINPHYRTIIEASPFVALATSGDGGLDCTPRGDHPGFVRVVDEHTVMLPDRPGNNRIDSLRNLMEDPRVALLFMVPGMSETLRINGRALISVDPALLESFAIDGKRPRSVLVVTVVSVYFQCAKALVRSKLWDPSTRVERAALPTPGMILADISRGAVDGATFDRDLPARIRAQLY